MLEKYLAILASGILLGGIYALIALGLTVILGVVRIMNLAQGAAVMFAMYLAFWVFKIFEIHPYLSAPLIILVSFFLGVFIQRFLVQPIPGAIMDMVLIATLGFSIFLENLALFLWGADYRTVHTAINNLIFRIGPINVAYPRLVAFITSILSALALYVFMKRTMIGKALRAVAQDREAAELMGIDSKRVYIYALGVGTALAGLAGVILIPMYYAFPGVGSYFMLAAVVVIFLGGLGNMIGCILGGFIIGILAKSFEQLQFAPMLVVTPLTFLGGAFYSIDMLPPHWRTVTLFNPIVYLVSGFRWSFYGHADVSVALSLGSIAAFLALCLGAIVWIFRSGYRLKN